MMKKTVQLMLSIALSFLVLFFLLQIVSVTDIKETLQQVDHTLVIWSAIFYVGLLVARTIRYLVFFKKDISTKNLFGIVSLYNFLNEFMPFRGGEVGYFYLMRKARIDTARNVTSLIIVRLFDFVMVIVLALLALLVLLASGTELWGMQKYAGLFILALAVGIVVFLLFMFHFQKVVRVTCSLLKRIKRLEKVSLLVEQKSHEIMEKLKSVWSLKFFWKMFGSSLLVWVAATFSYFFLFKSLGVDITPTMMFLVIAFPALALVVPVQGIAHVGSFEGPIALGFVFVGIAKESAVAASIAGHAILLGFSVVSGIVGFAMVTAFFRILNKENLIDKTPENA